MRKLTGYIGAMIIVFALMGSILAGYALNINGTNTVMNEYEKVTDVSGLYSHTQEPSYIDYNPASNYIGYKENQYDNPISSGYFKKINSGHILITGGTLSYNDENIAVSGGIPIICDNFYIEKTGSGFKYNDGLTNGQETINYFELYFQTDVNIILNLNGIIKYYTNDTFLIVWPSDDYDYYYKQGILRGNNDAVNVYFSDKKDLIGLTRANPQYDNTTLFIFTGEKLKSMSNGNITNSYILTNGGISDIETNVYYTNINYNVDWGGSNWKNYDLFYPKSVGIDSIGINYSESNRVNNYLMQTEYVGGTTTVTTQKLNLTPGMGLTDNTRAMSWGTIPKFWRANSQTYTYNGVNADVGLPTFTGTDFSDYTDNIRTYDILDIFDYYSITPDQPITIKPYGTSNYTLDNGESIGDNNFTKLRNSTYGSPGFMDDKWYCIYYPDSGLFDFYDKNDVKTQTSNVCYVSFCGSNARYGAIVDYNYNIIGYYDFGTTRPTPYLDISYTTETGGTTVYHYADITKGYSIKNDNLTNVTWNNAYVNGVIELLFRAENTQTIYHNDIIIGDNNISVDYSSNRFYITLNGGDPVDIGTWRNIVLDIDLNNGRLSVIPVRTFNSFTNVVLDNTNIIIGNLINPIPTNIIEWQPTANSLNFNIYSTSVFMNSYGVVMVDPTLDVTQYFTNLDNFYQMRLSNFSIYGQSMTINGVTGTVTGGTVTFNNETIQIKDMQITYADGNVIISDSYANIDLGAITDNTISMTGAWYFITELYSGYTTQKVIYDWDWSDFILEDKAFGVIYIGLCLIGLVVARKFCTMAITDYLLFIISIVIALTVPVIA